VEEQYRHVDDIGEAQDASETQVITVRYWAAARAAAGVASDEIAVDGSLALGEVLARARARHPDDRFARVLGVCSVLVGEQPVSGADAGDVVVPPGSSVELLPPFAGG